MTNDEHLRARLGRLDPMPSSRPVDPPTSPRAQDLLERAMLTTEPTTPTAAPRRRRALVAAAAAVAVVGAGAVLATSGGSEAPRRAPTTLALKAAAGGGLSLGSCLPFSVEILKQVPVAFGGTVTQVSDSAVSLHVDHWYKGGTADVVTVTVPAGPSTDGGSDFATGKHYLVTATEGSVNGCGLTGEASPDLQQYFDQAFAP
jgi:hypothetical protein